jgi:hypothetical protein
MRLMQAAKENPTTAAIIGLICYVTAADALLMRVSKDTISVRFGQWLQDPKTRVLCIGGTAALLAHLYLELPIPGQTKFRQIVTYKGKRKYEEVAHELGRHPDGTGPHNYC